MSKESVLIFPGYLGVNGGAEESTRNLLQYTNPDSQGWLLVSPSANQPEIAGVRSYALGKTYHPPLIGQEIPSIRELARLTTELQTMDPYTIILNHPDFFTSAVFFALPKKLQEKTYALWRGIVGYVPDKNVTGSIQRQVRNLKWTGFELLQRTVGNSVHMNLAVSQAAADSLRGIGISQNKIRVIPEQVGGEYNSQIRQGPDYIERRNKLLRQDELGVLVVSRISYEKGLDWVLDLYEKLHDELKYDNGTNNQRPFNTVRLTIAGDATGTRNEYFEGLKKRKDAIDATHQGVNKVVLEFIGRQGREKLQELYNLYDVLFMPSPKEGFGRVTAEALMGGMPVIGRTVCDATREILDAAPETVGRLADSPTDAAESILGFMKDSSMLTEMQQNAVKWAGQYFSQQRAEQGFWEAIGK